MERIFMELEKYGAIPREVDWGEIRGSGAFPPKE